MDSVAEVKLFGDSGVAVPAGDEPGKSVSREARSASSGRRGLFAGLSADARDAGGDGNFTRYDSAGALDQPLW